MKMTLYRRVKENMVRVQGEYDENINRWVIDMKKEETIQKKYETMIKELDAFGQEVCQEIIQDKTPILHALAYLHANNQCWNIKRKRGVEKATKYVLGGKTPEEKRARLEEIASWMTKLPRNMGTNIDSEYLRSTLWQHMTSSYYQYPLSSLMRLKEKGHSTLQIQKLHSGWKRICQKFKLNSWRTKNKLTFATYVKMRREKCGQKGIENYLSLQELKNK